MAISRVQAAGANGAGTAAITVSTPTSGNVGVLIVELADSLAKINTPSGWTLVGSGLAQGTSEACKAFVRVLDGTEGTTITASATGSALKMRAEYLEYSGVDTTTIFTNVSGTGFLYTVVAAVASITLGPITPSAGERQLVAGQSNASGATSATSWSNSFIERVNTDTNRGVAADLNVTADGSTAYSTVYAWTSGSNIAAAGFIIALNAASGGSTNITITGVRATATATGRAGGLRLAFGGPQAAAAATGRPGTARVAATGTRGLSTATGRPGTVSTSGSGSNVTVTGVRALATASGRVGFVSAGCMIAGTRALSTATGRVGSPKLAIGAVRASATAAGRAGGLRLAVAGARALATATGRQGAVRADTKLTGTRGLATATGRAGTVITGATSSAGFTPGTRVAIDGSASQVTIGGSRTGLSTDSGRTILRVGDA